MTEIGPDYGYYPNASKTWLVVKVGSLEESTAIFEGTDVTITMEGRRHLGAAIGSTTFIQNYIKQKASTWIRDVEYLSSIAASEPHPAYAAFTHSQINKWTYFSRTIPDIEEFLKPLEDTIRQQFLPALTGQNAFKHLERDLMALPVRHGGLGIINPSKNVSTIYEASRLISDQEHESSPPLSHTPPLVPQTPSVGTTKRTCGIATFEIPHRPRQRVPYEGDCDGSGFLAKHVDQKQSLQASDSLTLVSL